MFIFSYFKKAQIKANKISKAVNNAGVTSQIAAVGQADEGREGRDRL